jgi:hypothetical protein
MQQNWNPKTGNLTVILQNYEELAREYIQERHSMKMTAQHPPPPALPSPPVPNRVVTAPPDPDAQTPPVDAV